LFWLAVILAMSFSSIASPYVPPHVFIEAEGDTAWSERSNQARAAEELKNRGVFQEMEVEGAPGITVFARKDSDWVSLMKQKTPIVIGFYEAQQSIKRREALWPAIYIGFLPPLTLLAFGSLVLWALRGFRSGRDTDAT
jgi:hypothetical protein